MSTETIVSKWGDELAVRIPQAIADDAHINEGDSIVIDLDAEGTIVLRSSLPKYDLAELVSRITPDNVHAETDWGEPRGREHW
jgi:antitoxin MazE